MDSVPLAIATLGGYTMWFSVHYWRDKTTHWPTDPLKAVLTGKPLPTPSRGAAPSTNITYTPGSSSGSGSTTGTAGSGSVPSGQSLASYIKMGAQLAASGADTPDANRSLGQQMMTAYDSSWNGQWSSLDSLWTGESGWQTKIANPYSGAYGIPQALPGSKMASTGADWQTNPGTQIAWGLGYIKGRYGSPDATYQEWLSRNPHWY